MKAPASEPVIRNLMRPEQSRPNQYRFNSTGMGSSTRVTHCKGQVPNALAASQDINHVVLQNSGTSSTKALTW